MYIFGLLIILKKLWHESTMDFKISLQGASKGELEIFKRGLLAQSDAIYSEVTSPFNAKEFYKDQLSEANEKFRIAFKAHENAESAHATAIKENKGRMVIGNLEFAARHK